MSPRLSISNIAWPVVTRAEIYARLRDLDVCDIEVAPTKIAHWDQLDNAAIDAERVLIASFGLSVCSYQALYFQKPDLQLLGDETSFQDMLRHTVRVAQLTERLSGGGVAVFGAPRNRLRRDLDDGQAFARGVERFGRLAEAVEPYELVLALESAPAGYGGDFLTSAADCAAMVVRVNHPALKLHLDTGCMDLSGEDASAAAHEYSALIAHSHLSRPGLAAFDDGLTLPEVSFLAALKTVAHSGCVAIEMKETGDPFKSVITAIESTRVHLQMSVRD